MRPLTSAGRLAGCVLLTLLCATAALGQADLGRIEAIIQAGRQRAAEAAAIERAIRPLEQGGLTLADFLASLETEPESGPLAPDAWPESVERGRVLILAAEEGATDVSWTVAVAPDATEPSRWGDAEAATIAGASVLVVETLDADMVFVSVYRTVGSERLHSSSCIEVVGSDPDPEPDPDTSEKQIAFFAETADQAELTDAQRTMLASLTLREEIAAAGHTLVGVFDPDLSYVDGTIPARLSAWFAAAKGHAPCVAIAAQEGGTIAVHDLPKTEAELFALLGQAARPKPKPSAATKPKPPAKGPVGYRTVCEGGMCRRVPVYSREGR